MPPPLAIAGQHGVTDSGAATYSIPLRLPPGAAGLEPRLTLQYSSHGGNGSLGVGWSLGGLSAITRCPRTMASDNVRGAVHYDANDRFCLDGQRLILVSGTYGADGTQYRLERDPFTRVIGRGSAQSNTSYFEVNRRNGEQSLYGASADSRIEAQGKSIPAVWALYRQIDPNQNYLQCTYLEDNANGAWYPARVDYTGKLAGGAGSTTFPPHARVEFILEARPASDQIASYHAGSMRRLTQRIKQIKTYTDANYTNLITDYRLSYDTSPNTGASRITTVHECAASGSCLPATNVAWRWSGGVSAAHYTAQGVAVSPPSTTGCTFESDVDGDGRHECMTANPSGSNMLYTFFKWTGTDFQSITPTSSLPGTKLPAMDVNGDGRTDLVTREWNGAIRVHLSTGNGFTLASTTATPYEDYIEYNCRDEDGWWRCDTVDNKRGTRFYALDVNGDGRQDLVYRAPHTGVLTTWLSNGSGFTQAGSVSTPYTDDYVGSTWTPGRNHDGAIATGDFNGDGLGDLVVLEMVYGPGDLVVWLSNGSSFVKAGANAIGFFPSSYVCDEYNCENRYDMARWSRLRVQGSDFNGDGKSDVAVTELREGYEGRDRTFIGAWISNGKGGWASTMNCPASYGSNCIASLIDDFNGDGKADLFGWDAASSQYPDGRLFLNLGTSFTLYSYAGSVSPLSRHPAAQGVWSSDLNGDGRPELISFVNGLMRVVGLPASTQAPDMVAQIDTGFGGQYQFEYATLAQDGGAGLYDKGALPAYPLQAVQAPFAVVKRSIVAGAGTHSVTNYSYAGLKFELGTGRGLLGFASMTRSQPQAGRMTVTSFHQHYPLSGLTQSAVTTADNGSGTYVTVKSLTHTQRCVSVDWTQSPARSLGLDASAAGCTAAPGRSYFSYLAQSVEQGWDLNGAPLPTLTTANTYDCTASSPCWGNLTSSTSSASDGHSKSTSFSYRNDLARWHFGLPLGTSVSSSAPAWSGLGSAPPLQ